MKNKVLPFSKPFTKLYGQKSATLLHVDIRRRDQLNPKCVELDTVYEVSVVNPPVVNGEAGEKVKRKRYIDLPKTTLLILVFIGDKDIPFVTFQKYSQKKWQRLEKEAEEKTVYEIVVEDSDEKEKV